MHIPRNGFTFHGGCHGCTNGLEICPTCSYMEGNAALADLNPANIARERGRDIKKIEAYEAAGIPLPEYLVQVKREIGCG